jgi:hypothetical protein
MSVRQRIHDYVTITVYYLGWFTVALLLVFAVMFAACKIEQHTSHSRINRGYVTEKFVDGEHYWYSSWVFGDLSITRRHGGDKAYCITVQDGDAKECWTVTEDEWNTLNIGDYIGR